MYKTFNFKIFQLRHINTKMINIIVLKPNSGVNSGQNSSHWSRLGSQVELTWVNIWIKIVIVIILKTDMRVDSRKSSGYGSRGSNWLTWFFFKKVNRVLTRVLSRVDLSLWLGQVESILPLFFFFKFGPVRAPDQLVKLVMVS